MDNKTGLYVVSIVAIVGIVSILIMLTSGSGTDVSKDSFGRAVSTTATMSSSNLAGMVVSDTTVLVSTNDFTPRVSYWWGKVNQHINTATGVWETDPDGVSGADLDMLTYCKKWYPNTVSYEAYKTETFYGWREAGNNGGYTSTKPSYKCVSRTNTTYVPLLVAIGDTAPSTDTVLALYVINQLRLKGLIDPSENITIGQGQVTAKLFSEINAFQLDNKVTLVVYYGKAVIIVGANSPSSHAAFASTLSAILYAKGINVRTILSSDITSSNLADLFKTTLTCTDSDGGKDYYIKGTTTFGNTMGSGTSTDICFNATYLSENYCGSDSMNHVEIYQCPNGCSDGACLTSPTTNTTYTYIDVCGDGIVGMYEACDGSGIGYGGGVIITLHKSSNGASQETITVGGKEYVIKLLGVNGLTISATLDVNGERNTVTAPYSKTFSGANIHITSLSTVGETGDVTLVVKGGQITECLQLGDAFDDGELACASNCQFDTSACTGAGVCTDTDGGRNYYVKGTTSKNTSEEVWAQTDSCYIETDFNHGERVSSCAAGTNCQLTEYFCRAPGAQSYSLYYQIGVEYVDCPNGCKDGACVPSTTPPIQYGGMCILNNTNTAQCSYNGVLYTVEALGGCGTTATSLSISYKESGNEVTTNTFILQGYQTKLQNGVTLKNLGAPCSYPILNLQFTNEASQNVCTDSDGGRNFAVKGTQTSSTGSPATDYCTGNHLTEFFCIDGVRAGMDGYTCPGGCSDGACVNNPANFKIQTYEEHCGDNIVGWSENCDGDTIRADGFVSVELSRLSSTSGSKETITVGDKEYVVELLGLNGNTKTATIRVNGEATTLTLSQQKTISGIEFYISVLSIWDNSEIGRVSIVARAKSIYVCSDLNDGQLYTSGELSCTSDCRYDKSQCVGGVSECTDSDGINFYVKGYTETNTFGIEYDTCRLNAWNPNSQTWESNPVDSCAAGTNNNLYSLENPSGSKADNCVVAERTCSNDGSTYDTTLYCPNGCKDGACKSFVWTSDVTLKDFPQPFLRQGGIPDAVFVVGRRAALDDVIGITDIIASLQRYAGNNPFPIGLVQFDDVITDDQMYNRNVVIVGGMCANRVAEVMYGSPADCTEQDTPGVGKIRIMRNPKNTDKFVLLVHGYSAEDTTRATRVLANWNNYNQEFKENSELCITGPLSNILVSKCS